MKKNEDLQQDVEDAIKWEPLISAAEIGVIAKDGVITLTGVVDSYAKKLEAEEAAKSVTGVKAVVEKIEVQFGNRGKKTDFEIANDVLNALKQNWEIISDNIKVKVEDGWITLQGELNWNFQKEAAKACVNNLTGVKGVVNRITIRSETADKIEQADIESALQRNWSIDNKGIEVKVSGSNVKLNGKVTSFYEKDEAERIAWNAPGVSTVDNELVIVYDF